MSKREARREATDNLKAASKRMDWLNRAQDRRGVREENRSFWHQNRQVNEALDNKDLPWWRR